MPDFHMRADCRRWFGHLVGAGSLKTLFDCYYLCFLLGVASRRTSNPVEAGPAPAFVDNFVRPYDVHQRLLIGLMIDADLARLGVDLTDRVSVNRVVSEVASTSGLTSEGARRMDGYASGGFDLLLETYDEDEPRSLEEFLPRYLRIWASVSDI